MAHLARIKLPFPVQLAASSRLAKSVLLVLSLLVLALLAAHAQGSPFDTGFNAIQGLFTGTIAKVASLVAIVIGGYGFAHGEPGAKNAGVAAGTDIAVMAVNVLSWLWGV
ncbi:MAG: TrbC/VirB2 family protein [Candidatus Sulfotelmatobacter sp.]